MSGMTPPCLLGCYDHCHRAQLLRILNPSDSDDSDEMDEAFHDIGSNPDWQPLMDVSDLLWLQSTNMRVPLDG